MKPLHLLANKKNRPRALQYIQLKAGWVIASNAIALIKIPAHEVFGDAAEAIDECYFFGEDWARQKFDKAASFSVNELTFRAYNKGQFIGEIQATPGLDAKFPDVSSFWGQPEKERLSGRIEPESFNLLVKCFGQSLKGLFKFDFEGKNYMRITHPHSSAEGLIFIPDVEK